ncbi:MAG: RluA family pseudouridine synthase [Bacillota bacterium]|nr:RluA family pseudouridine synthase [Bacillota bacterium]
MSLTTITVDREERIDRVLARLIPERSRSELAPLFAAGAVTAGGRRLKASERLAPGTRVAVDLAVLAPRPLELEPEAENLALDIRYEDEWLLVVNKPAGMVVHPAPGHAGGTLVNALLYHYGDRLSRLGEHGRPGIVHRLDRDTTGLLLVARDDRVHRRLAAALARREIHRGYEALVLGRFDEGSGTIAAPLGRDPQNRQKQAVRADGRPSVTHFRVLSSYAQASHLSVELETGRTHQIRVHMAHIGHAVLGDPIYGSRRAERAAGLPPLPGEGQFLHAARLVLTHPVSGERLDISVPPPERFRQAQAALAEAGQP